MWFALWFSVVDRPDGSGPHEHVSCHHMTPYGREGFVSDLDSLPAMLRPHLLGDREHAGTLRCQCCGVVVLGEDASFERAKLDPGATLVESYPVALEDLAGADELVARVEEGEVVTLTRHGRAVADVVAREPRAQARSARRLLADLEEIAALAEELHVGR